MTPRDATRRRRLKAALAASLVAAAPWGWLAPRAVLAQPQGGSAPAGDGPSALERIRRAGRLQVAVYQDMPPFHDKGSGIDVEIGRALAKAVGVELALLPFVAGENMDDDLRAMVWRGHYLGFGPADVLLHVPVDAPLMNANPQVSIFAPYYRERLVIARDVRKVPKMETMADFKGQRIAVPGQSLAGWLLIGSDNGAYREQLETKLQDTREAVGRLKRGDAAAAAGHASEVESEVAGDPNIAIDPLPLPRMRDGWPIGVAVKKGSTDLARLVKETIEGMNANGEMRALFQKGKVAWRLP